MGLPLANVQTNDTFQTWLTRTNQIIVSTPNTEYVAANTYVNDQIGQLSSLLSSNIVSINSEIAQLSGLLTSNVNTINSSITNLSGLLTSNVNSLLASRAANTYVNALLANTNAFINTKLDKTGGSITGSLTVQQNLIVDGDVFFNGNSTIISTTDLRVSDPIIFLAANNNAADTLDIGFVASYNDGTISNNHTGLIRDSGTKEWYLFNKYPFTVNGNNNVNITEPSFKLANLNLADISANAISGNGALLTSLNATELTSGTLPAARLPLTGVTANTYGSGSLVPQITVDATGRVTEINNINVAGVTNFTFTTGNTTFTISTADGNSFSANIADDSIALGTKTTGNYVATVSNTDSNITVTGSGESAAVSVGLADNISVSGNVTAAFFIGDGSQLDNAGASVATDGGANRNLSVLFSGVSSGALLTANVASSLQFNPSSGTLTATAFSGNGSGLTSLDAGDISTGTLAVARGGTGTGTSATNGQLLIGTGSGFSLATITGTTNRVTVTNGSGTITLSGPQDLATSSDVQFDSFGVGTAASGTTGEIRATNNITAYYSDKRLKTNIKPIENALSKVMSINGITFVNNELARTFGYTDEQEQVGVLAQEIEEVLPQVVVPAPFDTAFDENEKMYSITGEDYKTVYYDKLVPLLIEAIKEQQQQIQSLTDKVNQLAK